MITQQLINRGGSKLEVTRHFIENGLDIPIPESVFWYSGQSLDSIRRDFERLRKPVIVRGSHPNDWHGMVGVIPTIRDVHTLSQVDKAIREIEAFMRTPEMKDFAEDEGFGYTPKAHALIQEQSCSPIGGSMLRYPNEPDKLIIEYVNCSARRRNRESILLAKYEEGSHVLSHSSLERSVRITDEELLQLIEMYKKVESCGLLPSGWSYHMEFGLSPLFFYQIRPFKQIEKPSFSVDQLYLGDTPHLRFDHTIGITPKEGIVLPFSVVPIAEFVFSTHEKPVCDITKPYGLVLDPREYYEDYAQFIPSGFYDNMPITVPIGRMVAFFKWEYLIDLFHGSYRFMKKAMISGFKYQSYNLGNTTLWGIPYSLQNYRGIGKLISDGTAGVFIPEEYL
jgi:hypothetical protein